MLRPHSYQPPEDGLPPQEVRVLSIQTEPWEDQSRRVRVTLEISPFLERPNLDVLLADENHQPAGSLNIIESIESRIVFTMHIRNPEAKGPFTITVKVHYPEIGLVDEKSSKFEIQEPLE